ncbi:MAG TPA: hypothetical protein VFR58_17190 [Flavisolibacter sp.]|nr:hypothetical protein [Flavisolibacter sp.]
MMEQRILGTWRTYKLFHFNGRVECHEPSRFIELSVDGDGNLKMFQSSDRRQATVLKPDQWKIEEVKKRRYLFFGKKEAFELITLEKEDLVLSSIAKGEKLFFAKMPGWHQRVEPIVTSVRHINPQSEAKDL